MSVSLFLLLSPSLPLSLSLPGAGWVGGVLAFTHCKHCTHWAQQGASGSRADGLWSSEGALCGSTIMVAPAGGGNRRAFRGGEVTAWPLATPLHSPRKFAANRGSVCSSHCLVWRLSLAGITGRWRPRVHARNACGGVGGTRAGQRGQDGDLRRQLGGRQRLPGRQRRQGWHTLTQCRTAFPRSFWASHLKSFSLARASETQHFRAASGPLSWSRFRLLAHRKRLALGHLEADWARPRA